MQRPNVVFITTHDAGYYCRLIGHQHETTDIGRDLCFEKHEPDFYPGTWEHIHGDDTAAKVCEFFDSQCKDQNRPFYLQVGNFETRSQPVPPYVFGDGDHYTGSNRFATPPVVELYDLAKDPNEFTNVADNPEYKAVRAELDAQLREWMVSVADPLLDGLVRTPYYEKALRDWART